EGRHRRHRACDGRRRNHGPRRAGAIPVDPPALQADAGRQFAVWMTPLWERLQPRALDLRQATKSSRLKPLPQGQMQGQGLAASAAPTGFAGADAPAVAVAVAVDLDLRGPSGAAEAADKTPQGRRTWMCGVFRGGRMPPRKIP